MSDELLEKIAEQMQILRDFAYGNVKLTDDLPRFDKRKSKRHRNSIVNHTAWLALRNYEIRLYQLKADVQQSNEGLLEKQRPVGGKEV